MEYRYVTKGTCSREIRFRLTDGQLQSVLFLDGCPGNALGIARLVEGQDARDVADKLRGIRCGRSRTSCPDQLALALYEALKEAVPARSGNRNGTDRV